MAQNQSLIVQLADPAVFGAFIDAGMRDLSYVAEWKRELGTPEYCASKAFHDYLAEYSAAMVGSVIDKNGNKPVHQLPTAAELVGSLSRMADKWQLDNDKLDQFYYMEQRYQDKQRSSFISANDRDSLVQYLFGLFQNAVIAPHKRIDMMYYEGLYKGTMTVSATNNTKSGISYTANLGVTSYKAQTAAWTTSSATPITDIINVVNKAGEKGKTILKIRMSAKTYRNMCSTTEVAGKFEMKFTKANVTANPISIEAMNAYLESVQLPTIEVEAPKFITYADGTSVSLIPDNRVVFQCAPKVAVLKIADPLEAIDPIPNKTYAQYDGNLVGFWRSDEGRFVDCEMWATPVFTGVKSFFILKTDEVEGA